MSKAVTPSRSAILKLAKQMNHEREQATELDPEDLQLSELTGLKGWEYLKEYIQRRKDDLKPQIDLTDSNDDEILKGYGLRTIIYDLVCSELDLIIRKVEDANKVVKESRG